MLSKKNKHIDSAYEHLQLISRDKKKRREYEAREKAVRDHNQFMREAAERGFEQGVEIGEQRGEERKMIEIAINFIQMGINDNTIVQGTGLSQEQIENLRKKYGVQQM